MGIDRKEILKSEWKSIFGYILEQQKSKLQWLQFENIT